MPGNLTEVSRLHQMSLGAGTWPKNQSRTYYRWRQLSPLFYEKRPWAVQFTAANQGEDSTE